MNFIKIPKKFIKKIKIKILLLFKELTINVDQIESKIKIPCR
jgi:hypothetical protein